MLLSVLVHEVKTWISSWQKKDSLRAVKIKAADRVRKYLEGTLHADDGLLFCSTCNVVINHLRKHKIDKHLESSYHTLKAKTSVWKQQTLKTALNCKTALQVEKIKIVQSWMKACCATNTPLLKSGNKNMTNFRQSKDANGDAIKKMFAAESYCPACFPCPFTSHKIAIMSILWHQISRSTSLKWTNFLSDLKNSFSY